jgi:type III secretory pathway component EscR
MSSTFLNDWLPLLLLAALPLLLAAATSFSKFSIVLLLLRNSVGNDQVPPTLVVSAVALVLSLVVMTPLLALLPADGLTTATATGGGENLLTLLPRLATLFEPWRAFLELNAGAEERALFLKLGHLNADTAILPAHLALGAFAITELKEAFLLGFAVALPFLLVDLAIAVTLQAIGLDSIPHATVALPAKILLFVAAGGWLLLTENLVVGYLLPGAAP